jgi:hypothetical protein
MIAHSQEALSQEVRTSDLAHPRIHRAVNPHDQPEGG